MIDPITEQIINDAKKTSMTKTTRQTKIARATGQLASVQARKMNDPLYKKMIYYRDLYRKYKERVHKKYAPRVRSKARR
jgi:hypothetical protein